MKVKYKNYELIIYDKRLPREQHVYALRTTWTKEEFMNHYAVYLLGADSFEIIEYESLY